MTWDNGVLTGLDLLVQAGKKPDEGDGVALQLHFVHGQESTQATVTVPATIGVIKQLLATFKAAALSRVPQNPCRVRIVGNEIVAVKHFLAPLTLELKEVTEDVDGNQA